MIIKALPSFRIKPVVRPINPVNAFTIRKATIVSEMMIFWRILETVFLLNLSIYTSCSKLSCIKEISAVSNATSVPLTPIAIPTSACASAGASFTPSPTIATCPYCFCNSVIALILSSGSNSARISSTPSSLPIASPVSITIFFTPADFKR